MPEVTITRTDTDNKARYVATAEGVEGEGELTLSKVSATLIIADHTDVPDTKHGLGVAAVLEAQISANPGAGLGHAGIVPQVDLRVFNRPPQTLDEDVVPPGPLQRAFDPLNRDARSASKHRD